MYKTKPKENDKKMNNVSAKTRKYPNLKIFSQIFLFIYYSEAAKKCFLINNTKQLNSSKMLYIPKTQKFP